jgi:hypothetical protein
MDGFKQNLYGSNRQLDSVLFYRKKCFLNLLKEMVHLNITSLNIRFKFKIHTDSSSILISNVSRFILIENFLMNYF